MWQTKKLGKICKTSSGGTPSRKNKKFYDGEIPWVKSGELNFNTIRDTEEKVSDEAVKESSAKLFPKGTLLIALYGATVGKLAFLGIDAATNQAVCAIMPENGLDNKYLYWFLFSIRKDLVGKSIGGAQPNISQTILKEVNIPVPPLPTQHRIVEKIEELFSGLDNGVENLKKARQQLKTYRQAVLKDAFEGKLTKEWRALRQAQDADDLPTLEELLRQIKAERSAHRRREIAEWEKEVEQWEKDGKKGRKPAKPRKVKELEPVGENEISDLPQIPDAWTYVRIGNLGSVGTGATPLKKEKSYYENGTIPWVTSGALNEEFVREASGFVTEKALRETNISLFPKHTLLVAMYGEGKTRGKCSELLIEATTNQAIAAIVQNEAERKTKDFLKYFLLKNYNDIRRLSSGGVQPNLNLGIIENTIVPLAPEQEQTQIVNEIESRLSVVDQLEQTINENLQKAEALRQSILKKAFRGELVKDVPANILEFQKSPQKYYNNTPTDLHAGLMCKIIDAHYKNEKHLKKLNHVKCEKIIHMLESHEGIELERNPVKDAAGPDDFPKLKKIEHRANAKNWFQIDKSLGGKFGYGYKPKRSLEYAISDLEKIEGLPLEAVDKMIDLFLKMDKEAAEIVATLYASWNNFLIDGHQPSDEEIVKAAREDWSMQKLSIKRERFIKALPWMRNQKLVPSGKGKKVSDRHK